MTTTRAWWPGTTTARLDVRFDQQSDRVRQVTLGDSRDLRQCSTADVQYVK
jgi:hypothetical protein